MIREYRAGKVVEESMFWLPRTPSNRTKRKRGTTTARKQDENDRAAVKTLARTLNANFTYGDLFCCLEYTDESLNALRSTLTDPDDVNAIRAAAEQDRYLFLRRLKNYLKKQGKEMKCAAVLSDIDGETGEVKRPHHHMVIPFVPFEVLRELWDKGDVHYDILRNQADYTPIALYMLRQVRRQPEKKKYFVTRNMAKPAVTERIARSCGELMPPKGAKLLSRSEYNEGRPQYIRYVAPPKKEKRGGKRE